MSDIHPCRGCGQPVPTDKCTECATKAVEAWIRERGKNAIADRYYR